MPRLIHLNGPPGVGKSTIARRYAADHPGVLTCDIDLLRRLVGGWEEDFLSSGALIRPVAIAMISTYLSGGHDVVLPQLLVRASELARFEAAATDVGAAFVEVVLMDDTPEATIARFHRRGQGDDDQDDDDQGDDDPWHAQVLRIVAAQGGDAVLEGYHRSLGELLAARPAAVLVRSVEGDVEATYERVLAAVDDDPVGLDDRS